MKYQPIIAREIPGAALCGMKGYVSEEVPPGTIIFCQGGKEVARIVNLTFED